MKRYVLIAFLFVSYVVRAQVPGRWEGQASLGGQSLLIAFNVSGNGAGGKLLATMDVPAQGAKAMPCDDVAIVGDSLLITIKTIGGRYAGRLNADRTAATGALHQGPYTIPLTLKRTGEVTALVRPQEPKAPFPYVAEEVEYDSPNRTVHLGATLTKPAGNGPFPAAILISGSGPEDRNETIFGHKPFWVIADYLTRRGIAVLRVDDRNVGKSTGPPNGTSADFAQDVLTSLDYLKSRSDINRTKIGLIGHSEGGMIAPMVAAQRPTDVAFLIALAGPGEKISDLMVQQNQAVLKSKGFNPTATEQYGRLVGAFINISITEADTARAYRKATEAFANWRKAVEPGTVVGLTGVTDDAKLGQYVRTMMQAYQSPWMRYFLAYDPMPAIRRLTCPVLALNGEKDIQVPAKPNLAGWQSALMQGGNKRYVVAEMPGLNHLFQHAKTGAVAEYGELTETFAPEALQRMGDWLTTEALR